MSRRQVALERLRACISKGEAIIGGGAGVGLSAKMQEAGGIDLLILYNSGRYRMAGRGSLAGLMPYGDANAIMLDMANETLTVPYWLVSAGLTLPRHVALGLDQPCVECVRDIADAAKKINAQVIVLYHGGPIVATPEDACYYMIGRVDGVHGFFGVRLPVEEAMKRAERREGEGGERVRIIDIVAWLASIGNGGRGRGVIDVQRCGKCVLLKGYDVFDESNETGTTTGSQNGTRSFASRSSMSTYLESDDEGDILGMDEKLKKQKRPGSTSVKHAWVTGRWMISILVLTTDVGRTRYGDGKGDGEGEDRENVNEEKAATEASSCQSGSLTLSAAIQRI